MRAKHVRVTEHHLVTHLVNGVGNVKSAFLLAHAGIEDHVIEKVSDFLGCSLAVSLQNGVTEFVHFLLRHAADGVKSLLGIPGAFLPESVHNVEKPAKGFQFFFACVHRKWFWKRKDTTKKAIFV